MEFEYSVEDEVDEMECGEAAQLTPLEMYAPAHRSRSWVQCIVKMTGSNCFRLYLEGSKRFLLSAKKFGPDQFYISSDENFHFVSKPPERKFLARIIDKRGVYYIGLNSCALCDKTLGKYTCGYNMEHRELLARVSYAIRSQCVGNGEEVNMRCMLVAIPLLENRCRVVWCPRALGSHSTTCFEQLSHMPGVSMRLINRLPEWDSDLNSLSLKFHANRITAASAKNFLLYEESVLLNRKPDKPLATDSGAMQFGKAFGIALTTFCQGS